MRHKEKHMKRVLATVLMIVALMAGQRAWAVSTFTVEATGNGNTFKIKRSDTSKAETIKITNENPLAMVVRGFFP